MSGGDNRRDSEKLVTGIGKTIFYVPLNPEEAREEVKRDQYREPPSRSLQEPVSYSEKFCYSKPVEVASPTSDFSSLQLTGSRDSFASIASQDVSSLQRRTPSVAEKQLSCYTIDSHEIRIAVVGNKCTGKTQLIRRAMGKKFDCHYNPDSIIKAHSKVMIYGQYTYTVILLELPEDAMTKQEDDVGFFSETMATFVVYDMSDEKSLSAAVEWKKRINNSVCFKSGDPIPVYLVGNKCDTQGQHYDGASTAAKHEFIDYLKTSAKTGDGITIAVEKAVKKVLKGSYPKPPTVCETPAYLKAK